MSYPIGEISALNQEYQPILYVVCLTLYSIGEISGINQEYQPIRDTCDYQARCIHIACMPSTNKERKKPKRWDSHTVFRKDQWKNIWWNEEERENVGWMKDELLIKPCVFLSRRDYQKGFCPALYIKQTAQAKHPSSQTHTHTHTHTHRMVWAVDMLCGNV